MIKQLNYKVNIYVLLIIAMFSVSTSPIIARMLSEVPAVSISFWRMFIGAGLLWLFSIVYPQIPLKRNNKIKTVIGGIFLGLHFYFFFQAIKLTTIANATFLGTLAPIFTLLIERFILNRKFERRILFPFFIVILGSLIIISNEYEFSSRYTQGNLYAIICSLWLGITFLISENVRKQASTVSYTRSLFLMAAITLAIMSSLQNEALLGFDKMEYFGLFLLGLIPTILGHNTFNYALKYIKPTVVASFPLGEPIIASIIAYFLFSEILGYEIFVGGIITLIGLYFLMKSQKRFL